MLTLAANICTEEFRPLWNVVGIIINVVWIGVLVFCVVWIVQIVMGAISKIGIEGSDTTSWANCWKLIRE